MPLLAPDGSELASTRDAWSPHVPLSPWAASSLPPFARARRFLEHVGTLPAFAWADVLRRADAVAPAARRDTMQHVGELLTMHARRQACDALLHVAHDAVDAARAAGRLGSESVQRAAAVATGSAFALVVRDRLSPAEFTILFMPFDAAVARQRSAGDELGRTSDEPRATVAAPLAVVPTVEARVCQAGVRRTVVLNPARELVPTSQRCASRCPRYADGRCAGRGDAVVAQP